MADAGGAGMVGLDWAWFCTDLLDRLGLADCVRANTMRARAAMVLTDGTSAGGCIVPITGAWFCTDLLDRLGLADCAWTSTMRARAAMVLADGMAAGGCIGLITGACVPVATAAV